MKMFCKRMVMVGIGLALTTSLLTGNVFAAPSKAEEVKISQALQKLDGAMFPLGNYNESNKNSFTGDSYVARLSSNDGVNVSNVTFVAGAHTYWHIHHGTCQVLLPVSGQGYYQIWGDVPKPLKIGETVTIPEGVKHWHGAAPQKLFQHVVVTGPAKYTNEWLEPVDNKVFQNLK